MIAKFEHDYFFLEKTSIVTVINWEAVDIEVIEIQITKNISIQIEKSLYRKFDLKNS